MKVRWRWWHAPIIAVVAIAALSVVVSIFSEDEEKEASIPISEVLTLVRNGEVDRIVVQRQKLDVYLAEQSSKRQSRIGASSDLLALLETIGAPEGRSPSVTFKGVPAWENWLNLGINLIAPIGFLVVAYFTFRHAVRDGLRTATREG